MIKGEETTHRCFKFIRFETRNMTDFDLGVSCKRGFCTLVNR